jgi:hypothetical protein
VKGYNDDKTKPGITLKVIEDEHIKKGEKKINGDILKRRKMLILYQLL